MQFEAIFAGAENFVSKAGNPYSKGSFIAAGGAVLSAFLPENVDLSTVVLGAKVTVHFSLKSGKFNAPEVKIEKVFVL